MNEVVFILLTISSLSIVHFAFVKQGSFLLYFVIWMCVLLLLSKLHLFENTDVLPPSFALVLIVSIFLCVYSFRRWKREAIHSTWLVALHWIRIPVEVGLYSLFLDGSIPKGMTFAGWNYDILMGISAVFIWMILYKKPEFVHSVFFKLWNGMGMVFLLIIVITAILSSPSPIQMMAFDQPNKALLSFPFILLPGVIVPLVFLSHFLLIYKGKRK